VNEYVPKMGEIIMSTQQQVSLQDTGSRPVVAMFMVLTILWTGCSSVKSAADGNRSPSTSAETKTVIIPVEGLICVACAARIKQTLQTIDGVSDVRVDLEHRSVRVRYRETKTSMDSLAGC
jgi:copper chaperone CopZ